MHKLPHLLLAVLDFLFPQREALRAIASLSPEQFIHRARRGEQQQDTSIAALFEYRDPLVRNAIWALKYHQSHHAARLLAVPLYDEIMALTGDVYTFERTNQFLVIPIPLSKKRLHERGYNQVELLAQELITLDEHEMLTLRTDILGRTRHTKNQTSLKNRQERLQNVKGCFSVVNLETLKGQTVILLDDVTTTGATLSEARRVLVEAGAREVFVGALAH